MYIISPLVSLVTHVPVICGVTRVTNVLTVRKSAGIYVHVASNGLGVSYAILLFIRSHVRSATWIGRVTCYLCYVTSTPLWLVCQVSDM